MVEKTRERKVFTTAELFQNINERLKERGLLPEILDYGCAAEISVPVKSDAFDTIGVVNFGESEGICLDIYVVGDIGQTDGGMVLIGVYKTLEEDITAYKKMGDLNAEFVYAMREFVDDHWECFKWTGVSVVFFKDGNSVSEYSCPSKTAADGIVNMNLDKYDYALVMDHETGHVEKVVDG